MTRQIHLWKIRGKSVPGSEHNKCKGTEAGTSLAGLKNQRKAYKAGPQVREKSMGDCNNHVFQFLNVMLWHLGTLLTLEGLPLPGLAHS